ncbi:MAG: DUF6452 family protein [Bacteroidales bacterium]|nr:DUF6452 family protein [Bacteroidales bacterium]MDY3913085.1 DUF6452 family protein [Sodaliphilus sp.]
MAMTTLHHTLLAATLLAATAALAACSSDGCTDNGSSLPLAAFYTSGSTQSLSVPNLTVRGIGAPGDSALLSAETVSQVYLPLRPSCDSTSFVLNYGSQSTTEARTTDTLTLRYRAVPAFVSQECGAMYVFEVGSWSATAHGIDSVAISDPVITNANRIAIKIYMRAQ